MKVGVPRETLPGEHRVALVPEVLPKLKAAGIDVLVERHAERISPALLRRKTAVVRQGFVPPSPGSDTTHPPRSIPGTESDATFTLLFTGTLYGSFRSGQGLVQALAQLPQPDLRLVAAGNTGPLNSDPEVPANRLCVLGMIDHLECLALQRQATVLRRLMQARSPRIPGTNNTAPNSKLQPIIAHT